MGSGRGVGLPAATGIPESTVETKGAVDEHAQPGQCLVRESVFLSWSLIQIHDPAQLERGSSGAVRPEKGEAAVSK